MNFTHDEPLALQLARAIGALDQARQKTERLRRLVAIGEAGAASLGVAEWELGQALRNVDRLRSQVDFGEPLDAA